MRIAILVIILATSVVLCYTLPYPKEEQKYEAQCKKVAFAFNKLN